MIDLNKKHHISNQTNDEPIGAIILAVLPFVMAFWALIEILL